MVSEPTDVSEEFTTEELSVVLVSVFASAVTVMSADPLKATPLMFLEVVRVAAEPVVFWLNVGKSEALAPRTEPFESTRRILDWIPEMENEVVVAFVVVELVTIIPIDEFGEIKPSEVVAHLELGTAPEAGHEVLQS